MKTIEEKAKAYDEALKQARNIKSKILQSHLSTESCKAVSEYIDEIIPELRESEDERIIQNLIDAFTEYKKSGGIDFHGIEINTLLSWLEKQKELFESGRGLYYYDGEKTTYCGYPATEENPYDFAMSRQKEHKPAWSEGDEENIGKLHRLLVICKGEKKFIPTSEYDKLDNWLKSLRPQPHWKPSEEQMKALDKAIPVCAGIAGKDEIYPLISLYEDLKKLM